jgi:hypothetical protein
VLELALLPSEIYCNRSQHSFSPLRAFFSFVVFEKMTLLYSPNSDFKTLFLSCAGFRNLFAGLIRAISGAGEMDAGRVRTERMAFGTKALYEHRVRQAHPCNHSRYFYLFVLVFLEWIPLG